MNVRQGDNVVVTSGKDKGKKGKVVRVLLKEGRIVVEGVNVRKKHRKPRKSGEKGQIIQLPSPFAVSNAKIVCAKCGKATRVKHGKEGDKNVRLCKKCGATL